MLVHASACQLFLILGLILAVSCTTYENRVCVNRLLGRAHSKKQTLKRFHLVFGLVLVIVFLLTGQYMDRVHNHLQGMADGPRMLYRTRHIYILLSALVHLGIGSYFKYRYGVRRILQLLGSLFITIAPILFIVGFFREPHLSGLYAPLSKTGIIMIAIGTALHLISSVKETETLKTP
jgi:hypothetical protein